MTQLLAHSANHQGGVHPLKEHSEEVARLASQFASKFNLQDEAYAAGLLHDMGKASSQFQHYLATNQHSVDHKSAGACYSISNQPVALSILGHHGGLPARSALKSIDGDFSQSQSKFATIVDLPIIQPAKLRSMQDEFACRMLFSCLVDADALSTEAHFNRRSAGDRQEYNLESISVSELKTMFDSAFDSMIANRKDDPISNLRQQVLSDCLNAANQPKGMFSLVAPTGTGKTFAFTAFALNHAIKHGMDRIIIVQPYLSIIDQSAKSYRKIFGDWLLEHHSNIQDKRRIDELAGENWSARLILTTLVQLGDSLGSNMPSKCRKLHRLSNSVVIIDECQSIPDHILLPMMDALRELTTSYGATVVLSSATQPDNKAIEIIKDAQSLFAQSRRVKVRYTGKLSHVMVTDMVAEKKQALCIVNTKKDAVALANLLPDALHLSTNMYGKHRMEVIEEVQRRLTNDESCTLVSTQIIEAGIDLDFPFVFRAIAPLHSIVQASGRCNRHGLRNGSEVVVFDLDGGGYPEKSYANGAKIAQKFLIDGKDIFDPLETQRFYRIYYRTLKDCGESVQKNREVFDYPSVAADWKVIKDEGTPVVIHTDESVRIMNSMIEGVELWRKLQPYTVSVRCNDFVGHENGVPVWLGGYDDRIGIVSNGLII